MTPLAIIAALSVGSVALVAIASVVVAGRADAALEAHRAHEAQLTLELDMIDETSPAEAHVLVSEWTRR